VGRFHRRVLYLSGLGSVALLATACGSGGSAPSSSEAPNSSASRSAGIVVVKAVTVPTYGHTLTDSTGKPLYSLSGSCTVVAPRRGRL
jgi:hypothetical protein